MLLVRALETGRIMTVFDRRLNSVLDNIKRVIPGLEAKQQFDVEWIRLRSASMPDIVVFNNLKSSWTQIVPPEDRGSFALINCRTGLHYGLWLHHLATPALRAEYQSGFHEIVSWS